MWHDEQDTFNSELKTYEFLKSIIKNSPTIVYKNWAQDWLNQFDSAKSILNTNTYKDVCQDSNFFKFLDMRRQYYLSSNWQTVCTKLDTESRDNWDSYNVLRAIYNIGFFYDRICNYEYQQGVVRDVHYYLNELANALP